MSNPPPFQQGPGPFGPAQPRPFVPPSSGRPGMPGPGMPPHPQDPNHFRPQPPSSQASIPNSPAMFRPQQRPPGAPAPGLGAPAPGLQGPATGLRGPSPAPAPGFRPMQPVDGFRPVGGPAVSGGPGFQPPAMRPGPMGQIGQPMTPLAGTAPLHAQQPLGPRQPSPAIRPGGAVPLPGQQPRPHPEPVRALSSPQINPQQNGPQPPNGAIPPSAPSQSPPQTPGPVPGTLGAGPAAPGGPDGLANQLGGMNINLAARASTRAKRVYASAPGGAPDGLGMQQNTPGQMPPMPPAPGAPGVGMQQPQQPPAQGYGMPQGAQPAAAPLFGQPGGGMFAAMVPPAQPQQQLPSSGFAQPPGARPYQPQNTPYAPVQNPGYAPGAPAPAGRPYGGRPSTDGGPGGAASRSRIDPNQIPSPLVVQESDQATYSAGSSYYTRSQAQPPLASSSFHAVDDGNCNPRFMRLTTYTFPCTDELANLTSIPLGVILQPLADLAPDEEPIETADYGEKGPIRCNRCRAYINPGFIYIEGGRKFRCNLCGMDNEVPAEHFSNLDMGGHRLDWDRRPELRKGTVEFVATGEYCARPPEPTCYVFAIDVSWNAVQSGMLAKCAQGIWELLYSGEKGLPEGTRVGFLTFDKAIHFYNLKAGLEQPQMLVVPDVEDIFVPLQAGFLVDPKQSRLVIENLLKTLPVIFENNRITEPMLGAAIQAAHAAMKDRGGKLCLFQTMLPVSGPGALKNREDAKLLGTDKERALYEPQEYFWTKIGQDCATAGICVDMYLFPSAYIDVATIGAVSALTGGDIYNYMNFEVNRDGQRFMGDLKRSLSRSFGYDALLRVRVSTAQPSDSFQGLKIAEYFGNFYMRNATDIELAGLDSAKTVGIALKHDGKLDEKAETAIQAALLYTTSSGQRRIRVHNISIPNTALLGNVFRCADMDTTMNYLAKAAVAQTVNVPIKTVRDQLGEKCIKILTAYRKHAASSTSPGQLILPESFKLYPLYNLCLLKNKAFRAGEMSSDVRVYNMRLLKSLSVGDSIALLYPRMLPLHNLQGEFGEIDARGQVKLPHGVRVSHERLDPSGAYLIENGQQMALWLGRGISVDFLRSVFGVEALEAIDVRMRSLLPLENPIARKVHNIIRRVQSDRSRYMQLQVVRQQLDTVMEAEFATLLVEDQNLDNLSYVDYLCAVHR
ncbi:COPII coat Sec23p-Sfb3p heterodimer component [Rhizophlyctis rosea]|nr:COPII coat Sec23p-Sfb3p heterodimer component [Rhizophlyctis rosea]